MNKNDLIDALAPRLGGRAAAALAVEAVVDAVLRQVAAGGAVAITGFGTFEPVDRAPRTGRNPHTGEAVPIPAVRTPRFRPGTYFRSVVADPGRLPADGLAGARVGSGDDDTAPEGPGRSTADAHPGSDGGVAETPGASTGTGVPASIRRAAREPKTAPGRRESPEDGSGRSAARRRSGTPATVRADRSEPATPPTVEPAGDPGAGARLTIGGQQITREMISAKKAQLARAKSDHDAPRPGAVGQDAGKQKAKKANKAKGKKAKGGGGKDKKKDKDRQGGRSS